MARRQEKSSGTTGCVIWIVVFLVLAGVFWPRNLGLAFMGVAFIGLVHLAVLVYDEITQAKFRENMSPEDFEHYCAAVLREMKWKARCSRAHSDQRLRPHHGAAQHLRFAYRLAGDHSRNA